MDVESRSRTKEVVAGVRITTQRLTVSRLLTNNISQGMSAYDARVQEQQTVDFGTVAEEHGDSWCVGGCQNKPRSQSATEPQ
jgi:hypothetical protein